MSRLIDNLVATDFRGRNPRDLTLELGTWAESNQRADIFADHPDFAQEFHNLKDEIARAKRPGFGQEFSGAFGSAVDDLQASGYAIGALAAHGAKAIGIPGAEPIRNNLLALMKEQQDEAATYQPSVGSYSEISGAHPIEDTARYLTYGAGTVAPSLLQSAASGLVGAGVGALAGSAVEPGGGTVVGAVGGALLGLAEKRLAQKALSRLIEAGAKEATLELAARTVTKEAVAAEAKQLALKYGAQAALTASSVGAEVGSIYADNPQDPGAALAFGIPAGLLDVIPESYVLGRFFKPGQAVSKDAAKNAVGFFRRFVEEAALTVPMEGGTEAAQTLLEIAAAKYSRGESPTSFTADDFRAATNAGIIGMIGGLGLAPVSASQNPGARVVDEPPLNFPQIGESSDPGQSFSRIEEEPYQMGAGPAGGAPGAISETGIDPAVQAAIDSANAAASALEQAKAATERMKQGSAAVAAVEPAAAIPGAPPAFNPLPPPGTGEDVDPEAGVAIANSPLANLVGQQVEYQGYRGALVRDREGNFMVLPPSRGSGRPLWIEVAGTGKDPATLASAVGIIPIDNPLPTPNPAARVAPNVGPTAPGPAGPSKVPLGDLFPSDLVPRPGRADVQGAPGGVLAAQRGFPAPAGLPAEPIAASAPPAPPAPAAGSSGSAIAAPAASGVSKVVENTEDVNAAPIKAPGDSDAAYRLKLVEWSKRQKATRKQPKKRWNLATLPDGSTDILNEIQEHGGVPRPPRGHTGGEWNGWKGAFGEHSIARYVARGSGGIDTWLPEFAREYGRTFGTVDDFYQTVIDAVKTREKATKAMLAEMKAGKESVDAQAKTDAFNKIVIENEGRRPRSQSAKPVQVDSLVVGDKFKGAREPIEVVGVDEDTNEVIVRDGPRFGEQRLPAGGMFYPDKKSLRRVPRAQIDDFVGGGDSAVEEPAALKPVPPGTTFLYEMGGARYYQMPDPDANAVAGYRGHRTVDIRKLVEDGYDVTTLPDIAVDPAVQAAIVPDPRAAPSGEQVVARAGNGVEALPPGQIPNLRRLRIFSQPAPRTAADESFGGGPVNPAPVEAGAIDENPLVVIDKAVLKFGKSESPVTAVIIDQATGSAYVRGAYRGAGNALFIDLASSRKGTASGQGSTVTAEADFVRGTEGRPAQRLFAEKLPSGAPRYTIYATGELVKGGGPRNWNTTAAALSAHPGLETAAKRWWNDQAVKRPAARATMPSAKSDIEAFPTDMAAWRRENPGPEAATAMLDRIREYANAQNKAHNNVLKGPKLDAWVENLRSGIEAMATIQQKQAVLLSADYLAAPAAAIDVMRTALQALTEGRDIDVVAFQSALTGAVQSAARTTGMVITPQQGRRIVAFALAALNGPVNADTVLSVLHEVGHIVTDGLPEPLRVAFQEAIEQMPWRQARWLMNPRSLDVRILANADPAQLSPEQRAALERLTPEEVAAARRVDPAVLADERATEHLAQLGWDKSEARGAIQALVRFAKELWLRMVMAIQTAMKGPGNTSPALARAYVENRYLQFIHRDSALARDRINDVMNWLGVKATTRQLIPVLPAGSDWEMRMQYVDLVTGELIPVDHALFTPDAQLVYLKTALDHAAKWVRDNPGGADDPTVRQTRRTAFSAPLSFTPTLQTNTVLAAINLEEEIYQGISADREIAPLLPRLGGTPITFESFMADWLRLPGEQMPAARRGEAVEWAKAATDPLTGAPVVYDPAIKVSALPEANETVTTADNTPQTIRLTESADKALQATIAALNDTQGRVQRKINSETNRALELTRQAATEKREFPAAAQKELDELNESIPLRTRIAAQLNAERKRLLAKFNPSDLVNVFPTQKYPTIPSPTATEEEILAAPQGTIPRDYKFTDKSVLAGHLSAMDAWLRVPENRDRGQIYGTVAEWYRKLNQIPVDLEIAGTAAVLRRTVTSSFADEFRHGGLRALQILGRKIFQVADVVNTHNERMAKAGADWSTAFKEFAVAVGESPDQSFKERVWDPLMRTWNFIDVSERNKIGGSGEGDLFSTMERALKASAGVSVDSEAKRAALRGLLMQTIENERQIRTVYEQYPALKVYDETMGTYRRLVSHGLVTGRRSVARHMTGLFMRMNPAWSDTSPVDDDGRTFAEVAGELYTSDQTAFEAKIAELFPSYVVKDFVEPIVSNNTPLFEVADVDSVPRKASPLRVRQAWAAAGGDVTQFAVELHRIEGGKPEDVGRTVGGVLAGFRRMFNEIKSDQDSKNGTEATGQEILPRQMMDARIANDWPAEWVSYSTYGTSDNLGLLHQLSRAVAFGPDAIAGSGELAQTIREAKNDLAEMYAVFDDHYRNGKSMKEIERLMGADEFRVARNSAKIVANLNKVETAFRQMSSHSNYLSGDFRLFNDALGLVSSLMVGNPRGAGINFIGDLLGPLVALKLSRPALRAMGTQIRTALADAGNSIIQAFGQDSAWNVDAAKRRIAAGVKDSDNYISWRDKINNMGPMLALTAPVGYESTGGKIARNVGRAAALARDILPNLGSPLQKSTPEATLSPKLRATVFGTSAAMTMNANIDAAYQVFTDLATRGVDYVNAMPLRERDGFARELELGVRDLDAHQLGYFGGLILNDKAAFDSMRNALETKMAGEKSVGDFVAKAYRRSQAAGDGAWDAISPSQFTGIINYANTEWTLQSNFASLPHWMQSGPLRPLFVFLTWPYNAMHRFGKSFVDPEGRIGRNENGKIAWWGENSTIADGMKAFFILAAPATIAGSFAIDWYDKYLLGKKQNLREAPLSTAIPVIGAALHPAAFLERIGRYGSAGFATDIVNQVVNFDTQRNLSLDNRIVAVNAIGSMINSMVTTPIQQGGNVTYASVGRPFLQSIGGSGVLQYLQIMQNLLGLNNQDAAINARINTGNYLRAAGRELNLPVRVSRGAGEAPTRATPYLQQMELAALVDNRDLFRDAYRKAITAARDDGRENPEKYVAENFAERHPLKRLFRSSPTETDYRKLLGLMDPYGAGQVRGAINSYNRYLVNWFGKKSYFGKKDESGMTVEELIKAANRINTDAEEAPNSLLAIP